MAEAKGAAKDWRSGGGRRPSAFGRGRSEPDHLEPPTMSRSRVQLATSYAPGVLMTWEGGKGICRTVPLANDITKQLEPTTIELIYENLRDFVTKWRERAIKAVPGALPELVLDAPFLNSRTGEANVERSDFQMTGPDRVGYVPYPLLYRCGVCGSTREYESVADQYRQPLPKKCHGHDARWTQVDVVYAHWSGEIQPLSPFNFNYDAQSGEVRQIRMCTCGSNNFKLLNSAPVFSEWRYVCEDCGNMRGLEKKCPDAVARLQAEQLAGGRPFQLVEVNMLPVSYRANSTFYPQRTSFIEFQDGSVVDLMTPQRTSALTAKLAQIHGIPFDEPSEDEIKEKVEASTSHAGEWDDYLGFMGMAQRADESGRPERARNYRDQAAELREGWFAAGIVDRGRLGSPGVLRAIA